MVEWHSRLNGRMDGCMMSCNNAKLHKQRMWGNEGIWSERKTNKMHSIDCKMNLPLIRSCLHSHRTTPRSANRLHTFNGYRMEPCVIETTEILRSVDNIDFHSNPLIVVAFFQTTWGSLANRKIGNCGDDDGCHNCINAIEHNHDDTFPNQTKTIDAMMQKTR